METRQQFGEYALFKRLATDPLGETWRAGRMGPEGVERVVLLRLWRGAAVDGASFGRELEGREELHKVLRSPHLAQGVALGLEGDTPYMAYEYVSGKSLQDLLRETRERPFPIPGEHALFVAERMAMGLTVAYDLRLEASRRVHGLLVPPLVWLSNEGEVKILGYEAAPAYATISPEALSSEELAPYVSPEVRGGENASPADDVYSLGTVLYEMLTGRQVPVAFDDAAALVAEARLATEGDPLPPPVADLLRASLAPATERISGIDRWCQELSRLILDGNYNPTTFNLAFFMHTLFRGDITRETEEVELESTASFRLEPATLAAAGTQSPTEAVAASDAEGLGDSGVEAVGQDATEPAAPSPVAEPEPSKDPERPPVAGVGKAADDRSGRRRAALIAAAVVALLAGGGAYYWFALRTPGGAEPAGTPPASTELPAADTTADLPVTATDEPGDAAAPTARGAGETTVEVSATGAEAATFPEPPATPEEIQATIRELVAERTGRMEQSLKAEYDTKLEELRVQLDEARRQAAEAEVEEVTQPATETAAATPSAGASPTGTSTTQAAGRQAAKAPPEEASTPAAVAETPPAEAEPTAPRETQPKREVEVRRGDLVGPGAGVTTPKLERQPQALYPMAARRFAREATVKLRVLVDENGRPIEVEQTSPNEGFGFDEAALKAARTSRWKPGEKNGVKVKMWVDLTILFKP